MASAVALALIYGTVYGALLGVVALGLSLIWGVMKVINLAHGEFIVLGAYLTIVLSRLLGIDPLATPIIDFLVGAVLGLVVFYAVLYKLIGKVDVITLKEEMMTLLAMFGLSIALYAALYIAASSGYGIKLYDTVPAKGAYAALGTLNIAGVTVEAIKVVLAVVSLAIAALTYFFLQRTTFGLSIRAVAQDATALSLVGINPVRAKALTMVLGTAISLMAGGFVALYMGSGISPELSHVYAPLSFAIVVLGTPGNVWGTMVAGFIIGFILSFVYALTNSINLGYVVAFITLVLVLAVKPEGLFARRR